jgi:hypothetical protein
MGDNILKNYNIGIWPVLLIIFILIWLMYGNSQYENTNNIEAMSMYGDTYIKIGSDQGLPYIRTVKGVIEVPNSKDAMHRLFDNTQYSCESALDDNTDDNTDDKSLEYLVQKNIEKYAIPKNITETRELTVSPLFETSGVNSYKFRL